MQLKSRLRGQRQTLQDRVKNTVNGKPRLILQEGVLEEVETVQRHKSSFLVSEVSCENSKYKMWRTDP